MANSSVQLEYTQALSRMLHRPATPRLDLSRIQTLLTILGNPHKRLHCFHVAGTNGKGSVCAMLESVLRHAGKKTGLYTSPHLACARERFVIDGLPISEAHFVSLESQIESAIKRMAETPTFFESTTAMAFLAFAEQEVDFCVIEVGLGGRLDATNVIHPIVCGITHIGLDHQAFLGHRLPEIAAEKAGIIKDNVPVVALRQDRDVLEVFSQTAKQKNAPLFIASPMVDPTVIPSYQLENRAVVKSMLQVSGIRISDSALESGIAEARWPGRYEKFRQDPLVLLDGAHNPLGIEALIGAIQADPELARKPIVAVAGHARGHEDGDFSRSWFAAGCLPTHLIATQARAPRSVPASDIAGDFARTGFSNVSVVAAPIEALREACSLATSIDAFVLVTGSLYLIGDIRAYLCGMRSDPELPHY